MPAWPKIRGTNFDLL